MNPRKAFLYLAAAALTTTAGAAQAEVDAEALLMDRCASCHEQLADGGLKRIDHIRKTPEGWEMTLARMSIWHGVRLTADERRVLVKHLADTRGLAPEETEPFRYALENRPNMVEAPDNEDLATFCARCHSYARVGLQRRDEDEWLKLVHTHVGQWPTIEYQAMARDRPWWDIATSDIVQALGEKWPHASDAWDAWKNADAPDPAGEWRIAGNQPGKGSYTGVMKVTAEGDDHFAVSYRLNYADGSFVDGTGRSVVYTGYEWRGSTILGERDVREVFALSKDGNEMTGRWYLADERETGGDFHAVRMDGPARIVSVSPAYAKQGEKVRITIAGTGLGGDVDFGHGVEVQEVLERSPQGVTVLATVADDCQLGPRDVTVGGTSAGGGLVVYDRVDHVAVEPGFAIARLGGGTTPAVPAWFEAVGYMAGPDGEAGTDDDVRIGVMPAEWSTAPFDEVAEMLEDVRHAGGFQGSGMFMPASAGPNPARPYQANNAGNLQVVASVDDGGRSVEGVGQLIVTVQRWNDPPIR